MSAIADKRFAWPDYARGIGIVLIAIYHTVTGVATAGLAGGWSMALFQPHGDITRDFRIVVFFLLSGFMARRTLEKHGTAYLATAVFKCIAYPYVLWTVVQAALLALTKAGNTVVRWSEIPGHVLNGWMQFWFLHTILMIFALDLLIRTLRGNQTVRVLAGIFILVGGSVAPSLGWTPLANLKDNYLYFALGGVLAAFKLDFSRFQLWSTFSGSATLLAFVHFHGCEFGTPLYPVSAVCGTVSFLSFCMLLPATRWLAPLQWIGRYSLEGFCLHVIFSAGVRWLLVRFGYTDFIGHCVIGTVVGVGFPIIAARLDEKYLGFLFRLPKSTRT